MVRQAFEIVTFVVPGFNDSDDELRRLAEFLVSVSPDIPWHVTAFHRDYKMTDPENSGGTGTGKTTLLSILGKSIPPDERVLVIEDTAEIHLAQENLVRFKPAACHCSPNRPDQRK